MPPSLVALNFRVWKNSVNDVYLVDLSECDNLYLSFGSSIEFIYRELVNLLILLGICSKTLRDILRNAGGGWYVENLTLNSTIYDYSYFQELK